MLQVVEPMRNLLPKGLKIQKIGLPQQDIHEVAAALFLQTEGQMWVRLQPEPKAYQAEGAGLYHLKMKPAPQ